MASVLALPQRKIKVTNAQVICRFVWFEGQTSSPNLRISPGNFTVEPAFWALLPGISGISRDTMKNFVWLFFLNLNHLTFCRIRILWWAKTHQAASQSGDLFHYVRTTSVHQTRAIFHPLSSVRAALGCLWGKGLSPLGHCQLAQPCLLWSCGLYYPQPTGYFRNSEMSLGWTCTKNDRLQTGLQSGVSLPWVILIRNINHWNNLSETQITDLYIHRSLLGTDPRDQTATGPLWEHSRFHFKNTTWEQN